MSIWSTTATIGYDDFGPGAIIGGNVHAYRDGWSNAYPNPDVDGPATIDLAIVPAFCCPGNADDDETGDEVGPWLRLSITSPHALTWWVKDADGNPTKAPIHGDVVLDPDAAVALRDALTEWIDTPKVQTDE